MNSQDDAADGITGMDVPIDAWTADDVRFWTGTARYHPWKDVAAFFRPDDPQPEVRPLARYQARPSPAQVVVVADDPNAIMLTIWRTEPPGLLAAELSPTGAIAVAIRLLEAAHAQQQRQRAREAPP